MRKASVSKITRTPNGVYKPVYFGKREIKPWTWLLEKGISILQAPKHSLTALGYLLYPGPSFFIVG